MRWLSKSVDTLVATWCDESNEDIPDVVVIGSGATAGCIGVTRGQVLTMIRAIHQGDRITIVN